MAEAKKEKRDIVTRAKNYFKMLFLPALGPAIRKSAKTAKQGSGGVESRGGLKEKFAGFPALERIDPGHLSGLIRGEHPQTIAVILAHLSPSRGGELLAALPGDMRAGVGMRTAHLGWVSPDIIVKIAGVLTREPEAAGNYDPGRRGGVQAVSELFTRMDPRAVRDIMAEIESRDPELAASIRGLTVRSEDIPATAGTGGE